MIENKWGGIHLEVGTVGYTCNWYKGLANLDGSRVWRPQPLNLEPLNLGTITRRKHC